MKQYSIVEILGDGISAELSESVHALLSVLPFRVDFRMVDLSLENRTRHKQEVYAQAKLAMTELHVAI